VFAAKEKALRERGKAPTTSQLCKPNAIYRGIEQHAVKTKKKEVSS